MGRRTEYLVVLGAGYRGGYFNESAIGFKRWKDLHGVENKSLSKECKEEDVRIAQEHISDKYSYKSLLAIMNSRLISKEEYEQE